MAKPTDKPADVAFNLDTFERPDAPDPFSVVLGGKRYVLQDAQDCDYRDLLEAQRAFYAGDPEKSIELIVRDEDRESFFANRPIRNSALEAMYLKYAAHYGIGEPGEANALPST